MINHVDGSLAFAASVDAAFANTLRAAWNTVLRDRGYPSGSPR
jgi:hypothetical protein